MHLLTQPVRRATLIGGRLALGRVRPHRGVSVAALLIGMDGHAAASVAVDVVALVRFLLPWRYVARETYRLLPRA